MRKVLIIVQFAFSMVMILGTLVVYGQMEFMKDQPLGFDADDVYVFRIPSDTTINNQLPSIMAEMERNPHVEGVSKSWNVPGMRFGELMMRVERDNKLEDASLRLMGFDERYLDLMDIELVDGRTSLDR